MNPYSIKALFKKELSDIFRDKKTLFMMVVIPLVLYPLLIVGMTLLMSSVSSNKMETVYKVAFEDVPASGELKELLEDEEQDFTYGLEVVEVSDASGALSAGKIDAYVSFRPENGASGEKGEGFATSEDGVKSLDGSLQITYYEANEHSATAEKALEDLINAYQEKLRSDNLKVLGLEEENLLYPYSYVVVGLSTVEETMGSTIGSAIPMMIIVSILLGAIYPAIDVTAGEKERGTLETLLTLPVTNLEMIMSKFLAVSIIACVSAVLNVFSMAAAFGFMMGMLTEGAGMHLNYADFIPAVLITVIVMVAFALFVTAVCMCVCVFAKSFKEANNYVTPVMLVFMFAGCAGMIPDFKLTHVTAVAPVVNVALLIKDLFQFKYDYALLGTVFLSNVIYSLITVMILGKIYNSEAVLFSEGLSSVKLVTRRSEMKENQMPGIGDVILLTGVTMLLFLYFGTFFQLRFGFFGLAMTQGIIIAMPLIYAWYIKTDKKRLFSIKRPKLTQLLGSFVLWIGGYALLLLLSAFLNLFMKESAENVEVLFDVFLEQPVILLVLVIALLPAVCEECLFRGFLFGTLRERTKRIVAVLVVSCLFGVYHMSLIKFFTTTLLGILLAYAVSETGSIFCSMLMHFCNNLVSVLIMKYEGEMKTLLPVLFKDKYGTADLIILVLAGAAGVCAGVFLLKTGRRKNAVI